MHYIIGTAGHIDHGKTSLVRALTGQDTDRLKEEKARGISIDLGFAHLDLPDGTRAGVVDVPGHERFIRNMLAGAHGIDLVLFTVAADDGVMPQTQEHLDILHLLGVTRAIFVVTKADLVSPDQIARVREDIEILTAGSSLEGSPSLTYSSVTGEGLDELRGLIADTLQHRQKAAPPGAFRLPVDRVFILQGHGLVVTGTALSGSIAPGEHVRALPGDGVFRVRSVHVHSEPVERGHWGQRVALNLGGVDKAAIERGHVICHESLDLVSHVLDVRLDAPPTSRAPLRNHGRVRVHLGTAERLARLSFFANVSSGSSGGPAYGRLSLSSPLQAMRGDHFVLRDAAATRTLAGGVVIDPWPQVLGRRRARRGETLAALDQGDPGAVLRAALNGRVAFAESLTWLRHFLNTNDDRLRALCTPVNGIRAFTLDDERMATTEDKWQRLVAAAQDTLRRFHEAHPLVSGMEMEELRGRLPFEIPPRLFRSVVDQLVMEAIVGRDGSAVRLPGHTVTLQDRDQELTHRIRALLNAEPLAPPELSQLEKALGVTRSRLAELLRILEREHAIVRVSSDFYFAHEAIERLKAAMHERFSPGGEVTPAAFREHFGTSRKYAIPLLEHLDRAGVTARIGDIRRMRKAAAPAER